MKAFIQAVLLEAERRASELPSRQLKTLYLGGGTPSMLSRTHLETLFTGLRSHFDLSQLEELTFEANPATFDEKKARFFVDQGVTRISLGIQSFDDEILQTLGREHSRAEAIESVKILHAIGMPEINIDLMFSIPKQSLASWRDTLETAISLKPHHISAYNLTYEEDTDFFEKFQLGSYQQTDDDNAEMYMLADELLGKAKFQHYETSNYAQSGFQSRHNQSYWAGADYIGLGPSAVSTINGTRWKNLADTAGYIKAIQLNRHAMTEIEELSDDDQRIERIALLLRTTEGLPVNYIHDSSSPFIEELLERNYAELNEHRLVLKNEGRMLVDPIAEKLI